VSSLTRGRFCSFRLLLSIASTVFLGVSPAGFVRIIFLYFIEREREEKVAGGSERHYIGVWFEKTKSSV
jgi:hypothetical protein